MNSRLRVSDQSVALAVVLLLSSVIVVAASVGPRGMLAFPSLSVVMASFAVAPPVGIVTLAATDRIR